MKRLGQRRRRGGSFCEHCARCEMAKAAQSSPNLAAVPDDFGPISAIRSYPEFPEQRKQKILERKIIVHLDPTCSGARVIGSRQSGSDATVLV